MSCQNLTLSVKFYWKNTVSDICRFCERLNNFWCLFVNSPAPELLLLMLTLTLTLAVNSGAGELTDKYPIFTMYVVGVWEQAPQICPKSGTAVQFPSYSYPASHSGFVQLDHSTYSRDNTYYNYYLFLNLKKFLGGVHYPNNKWLKSVVEAWLEDKRKMLYDVISYNDVTSAWSS